MDLQDVLDRLQDCVKHDPADNLRDFTAYITEEAGEVSACATAELKDREVDEPVESELADVLIATLGTMIHVNPDITAYDIFHLISKKITKWEDRTADRKMCYEDSLGKEYEEPWFAQ